MTFSTMNIEGPPKPLDALRSQNGVMQQQSIAR
jgi:hypothetical protein